MFVFQICICQHYRVGFRVGFSAGHEEHICSDGPWIFELWTARNTFLKQLNKTTAMRAYINIIKACQVYVLNPCFIFFYFFYKARMSFLFVTYTIIQSIMRSEMCSLHLTHPSGAVGSRLWQRPGEQLWTSCRSRDSNPQPWVTSGFKSNALSTRPTTARFSATQRIFSLKLRRNVQYKYVNRCRTESVYRGTNFYETRLALLVISVLQR